MTSEPMWLSLARNELGTKEVPGKGNNPAILKYAEDAGIAGIVNEDAVPWCAAFVGAMIARAGFKATLKANARSYQAWGEELRSPCLGAIVVLSRPPKEWMGHVAFYVGTDKTARRIRVIGGNQGDAVTIADFSVDRVVAYRWPAGGLIQPAWVGPIATQGQASVNPSAA